MAMKKSASDPAKYKPSTQERRTPKDDAAGFLTMDALGNADKGFMLGLSDQLVLLARAGTVGHQVDKRELNFMVSCVNGRQPRDQFEAMLAAQMAAIHLATMRYSKR